LLFILVMMLDVRLLFRKRLVRMRLIFFVWLIWLINLSRRRCPVRWRLPALPRWTALMRMIGMFWLCHVVAPVRRHKKRAVALGLMAQNTPPLGSSARRSG
jgi:hypothetical protein